ncbi:HNH endonuclease signature motif containing protein [Rhodococcus sp. NPDC080181]
MTNVDPELSAWARRDMKGEPCHYCGTPWRKGFHVDHAIPLARGGTDDWTNLVSACPRDNLRKGTKTEQEFFALLESESTNSTT